MDLVSHSHQVFNNSGKLSWCRGLKKLHLSDASRKWDGLGGAPNSHFLEVSWSQVREVVVDDLRNNNLFLLGQVPLLQTSGLSQGGQLGRQLACTCMIHSEVKIANIWPKSVFA